MPKAELFFNAGDIERQENFIIYPESLHPEDLEEIKQCIFRNDFTESGIKHFVQVEQYLQSTHGYPNPIMKKETSVWHYDIVKKGSILFRYGYDGRRETESNRMQYSVEGAFLPGIDLQKTVERYRRKGIDIIQKIGDALPNNIEKLLVLEKIELFHQMETTYKKSQKMDSLFNHFYVACYGEEITISKDIVTPRLYEMNPLGSFAYTKKKIKKLLY